MSRYFVLRHEKIGFILSYFIPITFVFMLWDSKKIRIGILIHAMFYLGNGFIAEWTGLVLQIIANGLFLYVWWWYYSKCLIILKTKDIPKKEII